MGGFVGQTLRKAFCAIGVCVLSACTGFNRPLSFQILLTDNGSLRIFTFDTQRLTLTEANGSPFLSPGAGATFAAGSTTGRYLWLIDLTSARVFSSSLAARSASLPSFTTAASVATAGTMFCTNGTETALLTAGTHSSGTANSAVFAVSSSGSLTSISTTSIANSFGCMSRASNSNQLYVLGNGTPNDFHLVELSAAGVTVLDSTSGGFRIGLMAEEASGAFLLGFSSSTGDYYVYNVTGNTLSYNNQVTPGTGPDALITAGGYIYAGFSSVQQVEQFEITKGGGVLQTTRTISLSHESNVLGKDPTGQYLLVAGGTSMGVYQIQSSGNLTLLASRAVVAPSSLWSGYLVSR